MSLFDEGPPRITEVELRELLRTVIIEVQKESNFCLFIDGLDEFSGNPQDLVGLITSLLPGNHIKICLSSRPWSEFEDAFEGKPNLKLEDLTYEDIKSFIHTRFAEDPGFQRLVKREHKYAGQLEDNITAKADGVFLWVNLVIRSLLTGMGNDDRVLDMQRRLNQLPPELEGLYTTMLNSLQGFYFNHAAEYFQLMKAWETSPPAVLIYLIDEMETPKDVKDRRDQGYDFSHDGMRQMVQTTRRRINISCRGLVEVTSSSIDKSSVDSFGSVQYTHKTVGDYIRRPEPSRPFSSETGMTPAVTQSYSTRNQRDWTYWRPGGTSLHLA
ncbi:hypothetical protein BDP81DRAFT_466727 [Colletotrichum phormii]|uniref:DUF7791 domain-containing protein n=1 Tax=Colletotrichum phormii TaxID=359342 RepID=A0AAI9ZBJ6_9PEZI|nr:uncharacterized protein BDP81DRAFT_466727 [Colletotrichum phormii]KAK1621507.1 hypothetical protein BDP81DRAFT_466727 [Colletotrichum phormii]